MLCLLLGGCTSYEYQFVPAESQPLTVRTDEDLVVQAAPARLRLRQEKSRCVLVVENAGSDTFAVDSAGSAIVDPSGQSRAIAPRLLPPGSYFKLILPPLREVEPRGPEFRIGLGMQVDAAPRQDAVKPIYLAIAPGATEFWEWDGDGEVRIVLALKQNEETKRHHFLLRRFKK
ncbi:MAG: hypothetical protein H7144_15375 [Burkholderiales bacterium]|nr:hypothetical protein [Phycisphaerae bacterium]